MILDWLSDLCSLHWTGGGHVHISVCTVTDYISINLAISSGFQCQCNIVLYPLTLVAARGANNDAYCQFRGNESVACMPLVLATTELSEGDQIRIANQAYIYWMTGSTVVGVVWALINALTFIALTEFIRTWTLK